MDKWEKFPVLKISCHVASLVKGAPVLKTSNATYNFQAAFYTVVQTIYLRMGLEAGV